MGGSLVLSLSFFFFSFVICRLSFVVGCLQSVCLSFFVVCRLSFALGLLSSVISDLMQFIHSDTLVISLSIYLLSLYHLSISLSTYLSVSTTYPSIHAKPSHTNSLVIFHLLHLTLYSNEHSICLSIILIFIAFIALIYLFSIYLFIYTKYHYNILSLTH